MSIYQSKEYDNLSRVFEKLQEILQNCFQNEVQEMIPKKELNTSIFWNDFNNDNQQTQTVSLQTVQGNIFDSIPQISNIEAIEKRINEFKINFISSRRKDQLFKRLRKQQQQKFNSRRKQMEGKYLFQNGVINRSWKGQINFKEGNKQDCQAITSQDIVKLTPDTDLNDTIISCYLKFVQNIVLDQQTAQQTYIFSTYFLEKILGDLIKQDITCFQKQTQATLQGVRKKVKQNFDNVRKWTRKFDLFAKKFVVIPINAYRHWNCIIIVNPGCLINPNLKGYIVYCDSMFEKKNIIVQAIRMYLQIQVKAKKQLEMNVNQKNLPAYQLLLPRQTNAHDCGLYMLCYIEFLLTNKHELLDNLKNIQNRKKLKLFPRSVVFTMRQRLKKLFISAVDQFHQHNKIFSQYRQQLKLLIQQSNQYDYDEINHSELQKYIKMNSGLDQQKLKDQKQNQYQLQIKFYLDPQVNYYQKDR